MYLRKLFFASQKFDVPIFCLYCSLISASLFKSSAHPLENFSFEKCLIAYRNFKFRFYLGSGFMWDQSLKDYFEISQSRLSLGLLRIFCSFFFHILLFNWTVTQRNLVLLVALVLNLCGAFKIIQYFFNWPFLAGFLNIALYFIFQDYFVSIMWALSLRWL